MLLRCERTAFRVQKHSFCNAKGNMMEIKQLQIVSKYVFYAVKIIAIKDVLFYVHVC